MTREFFRNENRFRNQLIAVLVLCIGLNIYFAISLTTQRSAIFTNDITTITDKTDREIWTEMTKAEKNAYVFGYYVGANRCWRTFADKKWKNKDMPSARDHAGIVDYVNRECEKGLKKFSMDQDVINAMVGDE